MNKYFDICVRLYNNMHLISKKCGSPRIIRQSVINKCIICKYTLRCSMCYNFYNHHGRYMFSHLTHLFIRVNRNTLRITILLSTKIAMIYVIM